MKKHIWILCFFFVLVTPYIAEVLGADFFESLDYGRRNAAYTYFYNKQYVNTAESEPDEEYEFPIPSMSNIKEYPSKYEEYFNDTLPIKRFWVRLNSELNYYLFKESTNENVIVGDANWLFYKEAIDSSLGKWTFSEEELAQIAENLQYEKDVLNSQNIELYVLIAPNKESIYEEYLPSWMSKKNNLSPAELLVNYLQKNTDLKIVFPKEALIKQKEETPNIELYHKLDTHWNCAGAYVAAKELACVLGKNLPDFEDISIEEMRFSGSDLTNMIGMPINNASCDYLISDYGEEELVLDVWDFESLIKYHNYTEDENIFVYRDSFSSALSQHLSVLYANSVYAHHNTNQKQIFDSNASIVILEYVERNIRGLGNREISFFTADIVSEGLDRYLLAQSIVPNKQGYYFEVKSINEDTGEQTILTKEPASKILKYVLDNGEQGIFEIDVVNKNGNIIEKKQVEY